MTGPTEIADLCYVAAGALGTAVALAGMAKAAGRTRHDLARHAARWTARAADRVREVAELPLPVSTPKVVPLAARAPAAKRDPRGYDATNAA